MWLLLVLPSVFAYDGDAFKTAVEGVQQLGSLEECEADCSNCQADCVNKPSCHLYNVLNNFLDRCLDVTVNSFSDSGSNHGNCRMKASTAKCVTQSKIFANYTAKLESCPDFAWNCTETRNYNRPTQKNGRFNR